MSENKINGLSYISAIWQAYLELGFKPTNAESYYTNVWYSGDSSSII